MVIVDLAVLFLPLFGALIAGAGGNRLGDKGARIVTSSCVSLSALLSLFLFKDIALDGAARTHVLATWIEGGAFLSHWALRLDTLSALMFAVVTFVSAMVHLYSVGYIRNGQSVPRFMSYLSLFTFFMLSLVGANDLLQLFFGWEGVGLCSYLLIGFAVQRPSANDAAIKAFLVNRAGDAAFLLALFGLFHLFGTLDLDRILREAPQFVENSIVIAERPFHALTVLCLLLFFGAAAKSAQIGFHTWLPDAMEGPTPVSALIHAATMVTAGVFLLVRLSPLFEQAPLALTVITLVGAITSVFAASIAMTQFDIKRTIAYSTISQLGYMVFAVGVSAYGAAMFHLVTHAFFKSLLFLAAGSVIVALCGEQDMRKMGGLWRKMPVTYVLMWIGCLAMAGIGLEGFVGFSGFFSKHMILEAAFARGTAQGFAAFALGLVAALMTGFYAWRLLILTFHGAPRAPAAKTARETSWVMLGPLVPLALGAVFAGSAAHGLFASPPEGAFWQGTLASASPAAFVHAPTLVRALPLIFALAGMGISIWLYVHRPEAPARIARKLGRVHRVVSNQFYIDKIYEILFVRTVRWFILLLRRRRAALDEIYDFLFVRVIQRLGDFLWRKGDDDLIDRLGADGVAAAARAVGALVQKVQTGFLYHYVFVMMAGLVVLVFLALLEG